MSVLISEKYRSILKINRYREIHYINSIRIYPGIKMIYVKNGTHKSLTFVSF